MYSGDDDARGVKKRALCHFVLCLRPWLFCRFSTARDMEFDGNGFV